jgi:NitT/TauT family transport system substrate-binding protein
MMGFKTKTILLAALAALAVGGSAQAQNAPCAKMDDVRVMMFSGLFADMTTYVAQDAGIFRKHCINATLVAVNTGSAGMAQLQAGSLHFSDTSVDNLVIARSKGLPVKVVVGESAGMPYSVVARKGLALPNASAGYPDALKGLAGKRLGVFGLGSGSEWFFRMLLRGAGVDPGSVTFVAVGAAPTQLAALQNGTIDAAIMADPAQDIAARAGIGDIIVDVRKPGVGPKEIVSLTGTFMVKVASDALIAENPQLVARFVAANRDAAAWARDPANLDALVTLMKARAPLGHDVTNADALVHDLVKQYAAFASAEVSRSSLAAWNNFEVIANNIPKPVAFEELVWSGAPIRD